MTECGAVDDGPDGASTAALTIELAVANGRTEPLAGSMVDCGELPAVCCNDGCDCAVDSEDVDGSREGESGAGDAVGAPWPSDGNQEALASIVDDGVPNDTGGACDGDSPGKADAEYVDSFEGVPEIGEVASAAAVPAHGYEQHV